MNKERKVAIMYDFDDTLAPGNMQEYAFIPNLEIDAGEFWEHCAVLAKEHNMDSVLEGVKDYVDGIECYHYTTKGTDKSKYLKEFCNKNNLMISGGSDFHHVGDALNGLDIPGEYFDKIKVKLGKKAKNISR